MFDDDAVRELADKLASSPQPAPVIMLSAAHEKPVSGFYFRGWRPSLGWVCVGIMLARGVGVPVAQLTMHLPVEPLDWTAFAAAITALGLGAMRSFDKQAGTSV